MLVRFDLSQVAWGRWNVLGAISLAIGGQILAGAVFGMYVGRWRAGSFDEVAALGRCALAVTAACAAFSVVMGDDRPVPMSVTLGAGAIALLLMAGARYGLRFWEERRLDAPSSATRAIVFGAGDGGLQALRAMRNPESRYRAVALLDDDPSMRNLRMLGVKVLGDRSDLAAVVESNGAEVLIIAVPSAPSQLIRELSDLALDLKLPVRVLPPTEELFEGRVGLSDIRPITEADLLGRHTIDTDIDAIASYLTGRVVLVTGAGGSIGSELCRQIDRFGPSRLVMLDRDESALHATTMSIHGRALLDSRDLVVANIRDRQRVMDVFDEHRPDVVFHAAALKHLPLLEMYPDEGLKTNVWGTQNLLEAAERFEVARFVNVSTDKAADPTSVLGYTKRLAERLAAATARRSMGTYLSVRFGNVLGSRGSMLGVFEAQVAKGGPITVTHPEVTRYFMTVREAVQLVIQAGAVGRDGEALVLDMGEPVKILDVARRLVAQADRPIEIVFTGLRPGEKLHEILLGQGEADERPAHPLISHVSVPPLPLESIAFLDDLPADDGLTAALARVGSKATETVILDA
ncbi:MAG: polysaccharide biosynthesis protein [Acidimicrobiales bacterium]|nr:polysaccharide biosynthesis protein [Acidimicrobiales bacterium]